MLSGTHIDTTTGEMLWAEVDDSRPDGIAEAHGIDLDALVAKIRGLGPAGGLAICDAVERWRILDGDPITNLRTAELVWDLDHDPLTGARLGA